MIKLLLSGKLESIWKVIKEIVLIVFAFPKYSWAFAVSYILGTPFRPPIESEGA